MMMFGAYFITITDDMRDRGQHTKEVKKNGH